MTIVCAQRCGDETWIGSDSRMVANFMLYPQPVQKWFLVDDWWVGFSGSYRMADLLRYRAPSLANLVSAFAVTNALRALTVDDGWKPIEEGSRDGPTRMDINCILVSPGLDVYEFGTAGVVCPAGDEFTAMGSGYEYALGAAEALSRIRSENGSGFIGPEIRMRAAIAAACKYDLGCGGEPFVKRLTRGAQ